MLLPSLRFEWAQGVVLTESLSATAQYELCPVAGAKTVHQSNKPLAATGDGMQ